MRKIICLALILMALAAQAAVVRFVSPQPGAQAVGVLPIEITTDATNVDRVEFFVDGNLVGVARKPPYRIAYDFGTSLQSRVVTANVHSGGYRRTDTATVNTAAITAGDTFTVDFVEVPLRIRSSRGLTAADFRVRENGVDQTIRDVHATRGPAMFVFVIDRSLSMGDGKLAEALGAVDGTRKLLRADDTLAVVLFNHNVSKLRMIGPREKLSSLFSNVVPSGGTSLRDALASIPRTQRTYAFVITDGGDRNSRLTDEEALRRISGTRTVIDAIVLGSGSRFLDRAAKNTGGRVVGSSPGGIERALRDLIVDINSRYTLAYQSNRSGRGWRSIAITPRRSGIQVVQARKGYYAE